MSPQELAYIIGALFPLLFMLLINLIFATIALNMARKRGLRITPAFFAGLFLGFVTLFFIAMFPKKESYLKL